MNLPRLDFRKDKKIGKGGVEGKMKSHLEVSNRKGGVMIGQPTSKRGSKNPIYARIYLESLNTKCSGLVVELTSPQCKSVVGASRAST